MDSQTSDLISNLHILTVFIGAFILVYYSFSKFYYEREASRLKKLVNTIIVLVLGYSIGFGNAFITETTGTNYLVEGYIWLKGVVLQFVQE